jgi:hypothetical protein
MKSIVSYSAVLNPEQFVGFVAVMALAASPAIEAGSAKRLVQKDSDLSITVYNQGVEWILAKRGQLPEIARTLQYGNRAEV